MTDDGLFYDPDLDEYTYLGTEKHDSGLALLEDGVPTFVLEEERFNREKHTRKFPFRALKAAFDDRGLSLSDIDVITTPWCRGIHFASDQTAPRSLASYVYGSACV